MAQARNPRAMRNLPLVAYRLTDEQRTAAEALAARRHVPLNALARDALMAEVARDAEQCGGHVNAPRTTDRGDGTKVVYDE